MPKSYFSYILLHYTKNLILILLGLTLSVTAIDYLDNGGRIIAGNNQKILYAFYTWEYMLTQFYPIVIIFATTVTYLSLVGKNVLVSLLSFGYSKKKLFLPMFLPAFILYIGMQLLQTGDFAYAKERAWSILHNSNANRAVDNLFFKYGDNFVYVKRLDPIKKVLHEVNIFEVKDNSIIGTINIKEAYFDGVYWVGKSAVKLSKRYRENADMRGYDKYKTGTQKILKGYKPEVIEMIYEGEYLSTIDAIQSYLLLKNQNLNLSKIKSTIYNKIVLPLFAFAMMVIIFFKTPYHTRYINAELLWALSLGGTILLWGLFYALFVLAKSGAVSPDISMLLPTLLLLLYSTFIYIVDTEKLT